jgi:hypothetical protein
MSVSDELRELPHALFCPNPDAIVAGLRDGTIRLSRDRGLSSPRCGSRRSIAARRASGAWPIATATPVTESKEGWACVCRPAQSTSTFAKTCHASRLFATRLSQR